jgi:hypothetical protein
VPTSPLVTTGYAAALLPTLSTGQQAALPALIVAASRSIESLTRRTFAPTIKDEWYDARSSGRLFLRSVPVLTITAIATGRTVPTVLDPTLYLVDGPTGELRAGNANGYYPADASAGSDWWGAWGNWSGSAGWQGVRVQYTAGYAPDPATPDDPTSGVPEDVKLACVELVRSALYRTTVLGSTIASESVGPRSVSYAAPAVVSVPSEIRDMLTPYRVYRLGD